MLAAQGVGKLGLFDALLPGLGGGLEIGGDRLAAREPLLENGDVALLGVDPADQFETALDLLPLPLDLLRVALIVPEAGFGDLAVYDRKVRLELRFVKDSRGRPQPSL